jgi:hypothetical protein
VNVQRGDLIIAAALVLLQLALPYHGIQWGDGLEFVAVSTHLGVAHPPGYPLFTLLAKGALLFPLGEPYLRVLMLVRLAAGIAAAGVFFAARALALAHEQPLTTARLIAALPAAFIMASTSWTAGLHQIEIYTLGAALTSWVMVALLNGKLLAAGILLGLASANHLPSLSLLPWFLVAVSQRVGTTPGKALGAIFSAVLIPIFLYGSLILRTLYPAPASILWGSTSNLPALFTHLRGGEYATHQLLSLAPGVPMTVDAWGTILQLRSQELLFALGASLGEGGGVPLALGMLLLVAAVTGLVIYQKRSPLDAMALGLAMLAQFFFVTIYMIPDIADYFLGIIVLLLPLIAVPLALVGERARSVLSTLAVLVLLGLAGRFFFTALPAAPHRQIPAAWQQRILDKLPSGAAVLTAGDADLYTLWYAQFANGQRHDLAVAGANFVRFPWFVHSLPPDDPARESLVFEPGPPPLGARPYALQLRSHFIEPLLRRGELFTTINDPNVLGVLEAHYRFTPVADLLLFEEQGLIQRAGLINVPPPLLYRIERPSPH